MTRAVKEAFLEEVEVWLGIKDSYELGGGESARGIPMNYLHGREKES